MFRNFIKSAVLSAMVTATPSMVAAENLFVSFEGTKTGFSPAQALRIDSLINDKDLCFKVVGLTGQKTDAVSKRLANRRAKNVTSYIQGRGKQVLNAYILKSNVQTNAQGNEGVVIDTQSCVGKLTRDTSPLLLLLGSVAVIGALSGTGTTTGTNPQ